MVNFILCCATFAAVLGTAELLHRRLHISAEDTRRFAHLSGSLVAATLPFLLGWGAIVVLGVGFTALMIIARNRGTLHGLHDVARTTWGEICFPAGLALLAVTQPSRAVFVYGALVMGVSDAVAGFVGQHRGRHRFHIGPASKSVEGCLAFFATTTVVGTVVLVIGGADGTLPVLLASGAALALTGVEMLLPWGLDNLVLPVAAAGLVGGISLMVW